MKKIIIVSFFLTILITGVCGCETRDGDKIKEIMKTYAEEKYSEEFYVVSFLQARDETWTDILTLSKDEDFIFNVYHSPKDTNFEKLEDDYEQELIDEKIREKLCSENDIKDVNFNVYASFKRDKRLTFENVKNLTADELLSEFTLLQVIGVICFDTPKENARYADEKIYSLYNSVYALGAEKTSFEVVYTDGEVDEKLHKCIFNIRAFYENDWTIYPEVRGYISAIGEIPLEKEEFFKRYKRVGNNRIFP